MLSGGKNLLKKTHNKWKSAGFLELLHDAKWYVPNKIARKSWILAGERQFEIYTNTRFQIQKMIFSAPSNPWRPIHINPAELEYVARPCHKTWGLGRIIGGDWDTPENLRSLKKFRVVKGLRQRYLEGKDWEDTDYIKDIERKFDSNRGIWGYRTEDEFLNVRCNFVDNLFESIKNEGYRPNFGADHNVPPIDYRNDPRNFDHSLEPLVAIGRDGDIYCLDGFHRLIIAQILGIDSIPVNVIARHRSWQKVRDEIYEAENKSKLSSDIQKFISHPDMTDMIT